MWTRASQSAPAPRGSNQRRCIPQGPCGLAIMGHDEPARRHLPHRLGPRRARRQRLHGRAAAGVLLPLAWRLTLGTSSHDDDHAMAPALPAGGRSIRNQPADAGFPPCPAVRLNVGPPRRQHRLRARAASMVRRPGCGGCRPDRTRPVHELWGAPRGHGKVAAPGPAVLVLLIGYSSVTVLPLVLATA